MLIIRCYEFVKLAFVKEHSWEGLGAGGEGDDRG